MTQVKITVTVPLTSSGHIPVKENKFKTVEGRAHMGNTPQRGASYLRVSYLAKDFPTAQPPVRSLASRMRRKAKRWFCAPARNTYN